VTGATGRPWKEAKPTLVVAIGKMPRMAEWPDYGTQAQLGYFGVNKFSIFFNSFHLAQKADFAPKNPARS
jgi:hypothetical protein